MRGQPLTLFERERIELYVRGNWGTRKIARALFRDHSVIVRELKRNRGRDGTYRAKDAQEMADKRSCRPHRRKLDTDERLREWIIQRLRDGWSPELIAGRCKNRPDPWMLGKTICHEAIYQYIYEGEGRFLGLYQYLVRRHKVRHRRYGRKPRKDKGILYMTPIAFRPKEIMERREMGHWESDSVIGRGSKAALSVQRERMTRRMKITKIANMTAEETEEVLRSLTEETPPGLVKSVTFDRGREGAHHWKLRLDYDIDTYHCDPYASYQKGAVENGNGLIRRTYPKGTDFSLITTQDIYATQEAINNRPLKVLGFQTPNEVWAEGTRQVVH